MHTAEPQPLPHRRRIGAATRGISLLEILIVVAIAGLLAVGATLSGRRALQGQEQNAAINTFQQSIWQGATSSAARGVRTELFRAGTDLQIRRLDNGAVVRQFELPNDAETNLPEGQVLIFTPPGKVDTATLAALPSPLTLTIGSRSVTMEISVIGEVRHGAYQ